MVHACISQLCLLCVAIRMRLGEGSDVNHCDDNNDDNNDKDDNDQVDDDDDVVVIIIH